MKYKGRNLDPPSVTPTDMTDIALNDLIDVTDIVVKASQT